MTNFTTFMAGISMATFFGAGVFFGKLWLASQDKFFLYFGMGCALLSVERVVALAVLGTLDNGNAQVMESSSWIYLLRLCAFTMILIAIIEKNRAK